MPTTVVGASSKMSVRPMIPGSAAKRRRQSPSLRITTGGRPGEVVVRREAPAPRRRHADQRKRVRGDVAGLQPLRRPAAGQGERSVGERRDLVKARDCSRRSKYSGTTQLAPGRVVQPGVNQLDAVGVLVRQGPEQHAVHHAEDRAGGADAEREGEDGERGEAGALPQAAERIAQVVEQRVDHSDLSDDMGSIRAARRAGIQQAAKATAARPSATTA